MNLFNIGITGKIELNPETIAIPPFKDIWERDKSSTKEKATREISYIVYLCDYRSPYIAYAEEYREGIIREDFIKDPNWVPDEVIISAIAKYKDLQYTPILRMLHSALGVSDKISSYFDKVNFEETDSKGNLKYDINDVLAAIDKVQRAIKTLKSLERQVKTEQMDSTSVRGNSEINEYEIPEE
jgi:hypothetical protein